MKRLLVLALLAGVSATTVACSRSEPPAEVQATEIAWRQGDVEDALAEAKETGKPVLLYWGAKWCPPCAQMKVTLFKDPAFIAKTQDFIPVYLDGDTDGAQKWGEHFGTNGYPTVIVLSPTGEEVTRLSSATMASELPELLTLAAGRTRTIDAVIADARADPATLSAQDWQILAAFDWGNDIKRFGEQKDEGALLSTLAEAAPDAALKRRFGLLALVRQAGSDADGNLVLDSKQADAARAALSEVLANADEVKANGMLIAFEAADLVGALPAGEGRDKLAAMLNVTLEAMEGDTSLSLVDRTAALRSEVTLADRTGGVPDSLKQKVRQWVADLDRQATDELVRKSVISFAAGALEQIGDRDGARKLMLAEVAKSSSAYYYMSILAGYAEDDGDKDGAIEWARKAYEASEGPATRVQWAASYSRAVMRLKPEDAEAVRKSAEAVLAEIGKSPDSYYQRTRRVIDRWSGAVVAWSEANDGAAVLAGLRKTCAGQGKGAACGALSKAS